MSGTVRASPYNHCCLLGFPESYLTWSLPSPLPGTHRAPPSSSAPHATPPLRYSPLHILAASAASSLESPSQSASSVPGDCSHFGLGSNSLHRGWEGAPRQEVGGDRQLTLCFSLLKDHSPAEPVVYHLETAVSNISLRAKPV